MGQENVAVVLDARLTLDEARRKITQLAEEIGDDADDGQEPQRQLHLPDKLRNKPQQHHAGGAADRARKEACPRFIGAHVRGKFLMAEGHAAQHRKAVANKRDDERHQDERGRDIAQQRNAAVHRREQKPADDADRDGGKRQRRFLPVRHDCDEKQRCDEHICAREIQPVTDRRPPAVHRDVCHGQDSHQHRQRVDERRDMLTRRVQQLPRGGSRDRRGQDPRGDRRQDDEHHDQQRHADGGHEQSLFHFRPPNRRSRVR